LNIVTGSQLGTWEDTHLLRCHRSGRTWPCSCLRVLDADAVLL